MPPDLPFPYSGPDALRQPVLDALTRVVDPEVALSIVDVGLVYGVNVTESALQVRMTMTSAACPMAGLIMDEVQAELDEVVPPELAIEVELVWEPPWTPERISETSRRFMGW